MVEGRYLSCLTLAFCHLLTNLILILHQIHQKHFPHLAVLARDYLACVGTSCSVDRTFSSAGDVCLGDRSGLLSQTIERAVGLRQWMKEGWYPPGDVGEMFELIDKLMATFKGKGKGKG